MDAPYCLPRSPVCVDWSLLHTVSGPGGDPQTPRSPEMEPRPEWNHDQCTARMDPKTNILMHQDTTKWCTYKQVNTTGILVLPPPQSLPSSPSPYHSSPYLPILPPPQPYLPFPPSLLLPSSHPYHPFPPSSPSHSLLPPSAYPVSLYQSKVAAEGGRKEQSVPQPEERNNTAKIS